MRPSSIALGQAAGDDQLLTIALRLEGGHLEDRIDGFFLCAFDEPARVDHNDVRLLLVRCDRVAVPRESAQHHFTVDEVFRAAQADKAYPGH